MPMIHEQQDILETQMEKLTEIRQSIQEALLVRPEKQSTDLARHYNQTLLCIQSARESIKKMRNILQIQSS